jgi:hypothetical protein
MLLALAVLLIHPQIARVTPSSMEIAATDASAIVSTSNITMSGENSSPASTGLNDSAAVSAAEASAALPDAPVPMMAVVRPSIPIAFLKSGKPLTVSVAQLQAENRRKEMAWTGLMIATSGAATFDAWTTRRAITRYGAVELNPMLKPFAGNSSLFAAIQIAPALLDFAGKKMMYSRHSWMRHAWWVPQSASFVSSIFCGAHNLSYH